MWRRGINAPYKKNYNPAIICTILIALSLSLFTSLHDFRLYFSILLLIYLLIGVPTTFLIDKFTNEDRNHQNKYLGFLLNLVLYALFGLFIGFVVGIFLPFPSLFYLQIGAICSVSFYIMLHVLELII